MIVAAVRNLQAALTTAGLFAGAADGQRTAALDGAAATFVGRRKSELSEDPGDWTAKRVAVAAYQLVLKDAGLAVGDIDGQWGTMTGDAHVTLMEIREFGAPVLFADVPPSTANPNAWPVDDVPLQRAMTTFYGPHGVKGGFEPPMTIIECPWVLKISWDLRLRTRRIGCHTKVAASLSRALAQVFAHYGEARIGELRLDIYGGCYNPRIKEGGTTWSVHSWAAALDFDPDNNQLRWGRDRATFARPEYDPWWRIWEAEGWVSLGRRKNFDWMQVQAAVPV